MVERRRSVTLPDYVERGAEAVLRPPYRAEDVEFYGFAIKASRPALDSLFHRYINEPSGGRYEYRAATDVVLIVFTNTPKLSSTDRFDQSIGHVTEKEASVWVLGVDPTSEELGFFVPYILVDNAEAVVTGREVYGFPKRLAAVAMPGAEAGRWHQDRSPLPIPENVSDLARGYLFEGSALASGAGSDKRVVSAAYPTYELDGSTYAPDEPWYENPLLQVRLTGNADALVPTDDTVWTRGDEAIEKVLEGVVKVPSPIFVGERTGRFSRGRAVALRGFSFSREQSSALGRLAEGIAENYDRTTVAFNLRALIEHGGVRLLFLKQFRDAYHRGKAAYQEVLPATMRFSGDRYVAGYPISAGRIAGGELTTGSGLEVAVGSNRLFPIRRELGLEETEVVEFAFYLRFGFTIELAEEDTRGH